MPGCLLKRPLKKDRAANQVTQARMLFSGSKRAKIPPTRIEKKGYREADSEANK